MTKARQVALDALFYLETENGYSNLVIDEALSDTELSPQDKALASSLFYGVLERKLTLDSIIKKLCRQTKSPIKLYVRIALRMGVYQIFYMDKIPPSAAVNEAVEAVKHSKYAFAAGFVNGVLRSAIRQKEELLPHKTTPESYSVFFSVQDWIVKSFLQDYGREITENFLENALQAPPVFLRVNTVKTAVAQFMAQLEECGVNYTQTVLPEALLVSGMGAVAKHPLYLQGLFHVQDLSSQLCAAAVDPQPGERVLDICAAPGGKTFTMAQQMQNKGQVVALDLHSHRAELICKSAKRLGLEIVHAGVGDATVYNADLGTFSKILCDVPCSGLGVIRRKPEIKYTKPEQVKNLPAVQMQILSNAARYLQPEGTLVYSTCTLRKAENNDVVRDFLGTHPDFSLQREETIFPDAYNSDGFYFAVLKKEGAPCL